MTWCNNNSEDDGVMIQLVTRVKFDPTDQEILEHLEAKVLSDMRKLHPLIDEFITTIEGENGICYTHPEKLPGHFLSFQQVIHHLNPSLLVKL
ncbi:hypothetical protein OIU77_021791 [Salix suchowensis]|uniref:Uncharacterized protein n=1 Tax=Salix suchowensis TaxID=1278906 RepID=A0ABQ9CEY7_9ROSI|nr:hypothetical protein OIU77_021791 [Salix suchowensis]